MMTQEQMQRRAKFMEEIRAVINKHSMENGSNTPDFLLAEYLLGCLSMYENTIQRRDQWFGLNVWERKNETSPSST